MIFRMCECPQMNNWAAQLFGVLAADILAVDIAIHPAQRFESSKPGGHFNRAEVTGVPDLIAGFEMPENVVVEEMMGVG
jgi:hypothetical protein